MKYTCDLEQCTSETNGEKSAEKSLKKNMIKRTLVIMTMTVECSQMDTFYPECTPCHDQLFHHLPPFSLEMIEIKIEPITFLFGFLCPSSNISFLSIRASVVGFWWLCITPFANYCAADRSFHQLRHSSDKVEILHDTWRGREWERRAKIKRRNKRERREK